MAMTARIFAGILGAIVFAAMTHVAVVHGAKGYYSAEGVLLTALGIAAAGGAIYSGWLWRNGAIVVSIALMVGVFVAEFSNLQRTTERLALSRDQKHAPRKAAVQARKEAEQRIGNATAQLAQLTTTPRLTLAVSENARISKMTSEAVIARSCGRRCERDNQRQQAAAKAEVEAARAELTAMRRAAKDRLDAAKAVLGAIPAPPTVSPLARDLGIGAKWLDLSYPAAISLAAVLLGAVFLHFAGSGLHGAAAESKAKPVENDEVTVYPVQVGEMPSNIMQRFCSERLSYSQGGKTDLMDVYREYKRWCLATGRAPMSERDTAILLRSPLESNDVSFGLVDGAPHAIGVEIVDTPKLIEAA